MVLPNTIDRDRKRVEIAAAVHALESALESLVLALTHEATFASAAGSATEREALRMICEAYGQVRYAPDQEVNSSPVCLGVVAAPPNVVGRAESVNAAKLRLRAACKGIQNLRVRVPVKDGAGGHVVKLVPLVRLILRELQRSDLNLLAAYRKIPMLTGRVARVAYTRARTRAVYRKSRLEIANMLSNLDRPGVMEDRQRLDQLPAVETHLALVKDRYTNVRANVWFEGLDARNRGRIQVSAELPILYPTGRHYRAPEICYPGLIGEEREPVVRTGKLSDQQFLSTLPVYRYRTEHR